MRNRLNIVAASVAVAISGQAGAGALGAANEIFVGGATAPQNFYREDIVQRICNGNVAQPVQVFTDRVAVLPDETPGGNILATADHQVVRCQANNFGGGAAALSGEDIAIYKFNGGSATGVSPVADPANADSGVIQYLDASVAGCTPVLNSSNQNEWPIGNTANTYELYECPNASLIRSQVPDAGISDVEPTLFVDALALDAGLEPTGVAQRDPQPFVDTGNLNVLPGPGLLFGVGVSLPMYDELIDMQNTPGATDMLPDCPNNPTRAERDSIACMPSVPSAVVRDVSGGRLTNWQDADFYGKKLNPNSSRVNYSFDPNEVHFCRRTNGSGTHAQFSVHFQGTNCTSTTNFATAEQNDGIPVLNSAPGVYANSGSSDMSDCLDAFGNGNGFNGDFASLPPAIGGGGDSTVVPGRGGQFTGTAFDLDYQVYGMGYNSMENNTSLSFDYRFVKVDFVAPTLENGVNGSYKDIYYLSFQNRVNGGNPDLRTGAIRTTPASASEVAVARAYFTIWNAIAPNAVNAVNQGLTVDPDGTPGTGDEWETGFLSPIAGASSLYTPGTPATPFTRQDASGGADSCQALSLVR